MSKVWLYTIIILLVCASLSEGKKHSYRKKASCKEIEECIKGENDIECVKRVKRNCPESIPSTCNECDCGYCSENKCSSTCDSCCSLGGPAAQPCTNSYCCYKTCHAQCRSHTCRSRCRNSCDKQIEETISSSSGSVAVQQAQVVNVTTVINLHNKINNTNQIDVPVNVNTTNYNNVTIDADNLVNQNVAVGPPLPYPEPNSQSQKPPPHQYPQKPPACCQIISPRQCVPQRQYPFSKCFHYRRKHCGPTCTSHIMHAQPHQVCDQVESGSPQCHAQLIYIPQPQPRCVYQPTWPYVNCGGPPPNCEGCYDPQKTEEAKQSCSPSCFGGFEAIGPQAPPPFAPPFGGYPGSFNPFYGNPYPPYQGLPYGGQMPYGYPPSLLTGSISSPNMDNSGSVIMDGNSMPAGLSGIINQKSQSGDANRRKDGPNVPSMDLMSAFPLSAGYQPFSGNSIPDYSNGIDYEFEDYNAYSDLRKRGAQYTTKGKRTVSENKRKKQEENGKKEAMVKIGPKDSQSTVQQTAADKV